MFSNVHIWVLCTEINQLTEVQVSQSVSVLIKKYTSLFREVLQGTVRLLSNNKSGQSIKPLTILHNNKTAALIFRFSTKGSSNNNNRQ